MAESLDILQSLIQPDTISPRYEVFVENSAPVTCELGKISDKSSDKIVTCGKNSENTSDKNSDKPVTDQNVCEYEMIQGQRRDKTILHSIKESQLYVRNKVHPNGKVAYTCRIRHCRARVYVKDGCCCYFAERCCYFAEPFHGHSHGNKSDEISALKLIANIKGECEKPAVSNHFSNF